MVKGLSLNDGEKVLIKMTVHIFGGIRDMNLEQVFECGQCFRWNKMEDGRYLGAAGEHVCIASLDETESILRLEVSGGDRDFWYNYFDLGTDYSAIKAGLIAGDPKMLEACEAGYGIRILRQDYFETLISFIISQNNNIPRIKKCIEALAERYGESEHMGMKSFPRPEVLAATTSEELGELKLGYRSEYIVRAAQRYLEVGYPEDPETVVDYHGVGPKVANCIKLFGLRCFDAFPIDTWMKKIMSEMYGFKESDVKGMQNFAEEHFGEYGGIAQQYLFHYFRNVR